MFPKSLRNSRGEVGCFLFKVLAQRVCWHTAFYAVNLDQCTNPIRTQVMGLLRAKADALSVLSPGFFPVAACESQIGQLGIQLGTAWIEVQFPLYEFNGSVFVVKLQPQICRLDHNPRAHFGLAG